MRMNESNLEKRKRKKEKERMGLELGSAALYINGHDERKYPEYNFF